MILCDRDLHALLKDGFLVQPYDPDLVNPASIDIRIGKYLITDELRPDLDQRKLVGSEQHPSLLHGHGFCLVETYERLIVPNGYSLELKLKSSRAREGFNHSLAFWFDPGWDGIGTMEISNLRKRTLRFWYGMRFAQVIVHRNSGESQKPYSGRYQHAHMVEASKPTLPI